MSIMAKIRVKNDFVYLDNRLPTYAHHGDAAMDLRADIEGPILLPPTGRVMVPTGLYVALTEDHSADYRYALLVLPRSGLAINYGVTVLNTPGLIDETYRGEIRVILVNHGSNDYTIEPGARIAQAMLVKVEHIEWEVVDQLADSTRGTGGFGSTGVS
jgi:dUTP pyrophosphatase